MLPLSSPFIQYFWRERLQKWVLEVFKVSSSEALCIQAIISTVPSVSSWMMAGIKPWASYFRVSTHWVSMASSFLNPDGHARPAQIAFGLGNAVGAKVENTGREDGIGMAQGQ